MRLRRAWPGLLLMIGLVAQTPTATAATGPSPSASPSPTASSSASPSPSATTRPPSRTAGPSATPAPSGARPAASPSGSRSTSPSASPSTSPSVDAAQLERERRALQAQAELYAAASAYQHAHTAVTQAEVAASQAELDAQVATRAAATARHLLAEYAAHLYRQSMPDGLTALLSTDPRDMAQLMRVEVYNDRIGDVNDERLRTAHRQVEAAKEARAHARRARAQATTAAAEAAGQLDRLRVRAEAITGELDAAVIAAARERAEAAARAAAANGAAVRRWDGYLSTLSAARIVPPPAADLVDPARLPPGLQPLRDRQGRPIPGVAVASTGRGPVTVLPAETVQAVSSATRALGRPYLPEAAGPEFYDCGRLTSRVWGATGRRLPADPAGQQRLLRPVPADTAQIGDLVFVGNGGGTTNVGLYLGEGQLLAASAAAGQVQAGPLPSGRIAFARATLPRPAAASAAAPARGWRCGAPDLSSRGNTSWGGHLNGMIPPAALCPLPTNPGQLLRCDAARSMQALGAAYLARFHSPLCITDSYRSIAGQIAVFALKPDLAAVPGTSEHGWGLAVDLCGGIDRFGTPQHQWMRDNAPRFGWAHPGWAREAGGKPEAWHWEFTGRAAR